MSLSKETEKELVEGCKRNDRLSQERLYKQFQGKMMAMCLRYTGDYERSLDVMNAGFLKVFMKIDLYGFNGSLEGWIRTIIVRVIADYYKKNVRYHENILLEDKDMLIDEDGLDQLYAEDIRKMIATLPRATRIVFNLFAIDGYKHEEISKMLNITTGTSKWHVAKARKQLQEMLKKNYSSINTLEYE
jgi:RNA polymerase sigma factor (sigma-70 family)